LVNLTNDGLSQINQGMPQWVRDGQPASVNGKIAQAAARQTCRQFAADPGSFGSYDQAALPDLCRPYLDDIGGTPDFLPAPGNPGGQCVGSKYSITSAARVIPKNQSIAPYDVGPVTTGCPSINPYIGPLANHRIGIIPGTNSLGALIDVEVGTPNQRTINAAFGFAADEYTLILTQSSWAPCPGQPNNCGNPPPTINPPTGVPFPPDPLPPIVIPPGPGLPGPAIPITINPDPDGGWEICFDTVCIKIDPFNPEGGGDDPASPPLPPGDQGQPGGGGQTGPGGDEEGEAPPGEVLVGLLLELTTIPVGAKLAGEGIYRAPCWIYMGGNAGLDQDFAGSALAQTQFVNAETENATKWRVQANPGYDIRVTPYYREVEE
jgi:hypothetical protein